MIYSLIFPISSLIYLIILLIIYYSKKYFNTVQNKLYRMMMLSSLLFIIFQLFSIFCLMNIKTDFSIFITWRISWASCIIWYATFYFYFIAFINSEQKLLL